VRKNLWGISVALVSLMACAPDPVQQAFDRCVSKAVDTARAANAGLLNPLPDDQKKQLEQTVKTGAEGACGIIKSVCGTDRNGQACQTLLKTAGVQP
jgi:hypothetical protein